MRTHRFLLGMIISSTSLGVLACESPARLKIPVDGLVEQPSRLTFQVDMLKYVADMAEFVDCIREEYGSVARDDSDSPELERLAQLNNNAVAELELARDLYVEHVGSIEELTALQPLTCIEARRGATPDVIDSRNVLFYTQDGDIYRNVLPRECDGLTPVMTNLRFLDTF